MGLKFLRNDLIILSEIILRVKIRGSDVKSTKERMNNPYRTKIIIYCES